jgi:hypothetical protein
MGAARPDSLHNPERIEMRWDEIAHGERGVRFSAQMNDRWQKEKSYMVAAAAAAAAAAQS